MGSHSVTCHLTEVRLNPSLRPVLNFLPTPEGWKAELTYSRQYKTDC